MGQEYVVLFWLLAAAVGAAMALGTGAALYQWRRTGRMPAQAESEAEAPSVRALGVRAALGVVVTVAGVAGALAALR